MAMAVDNVQYSGAFRVGLGPFVYLVLELLV